MKRMQKCNLKVWLEKTTVSIFVCISKTLIYKGDMILFILL